MKLQAIVDQIDVHGYEQARGPRSELYEASVGKVLWNSEYGEGDASGVSSHMLHRLPRYLKSISFC